jgi:predicted phage terminase large subunit-like protein
MSVDLDHLSSEQIELLIARIPELPLQEKVQLLEQLEAYDIKNARRRAREDFLVFCHRVYPGFKEGPHHRHLKPLLHDMARSSWEGSEPPPHALRLTVSMPPRFSKSESIAFLYVAWYMGHNPSHQVMMITHTEELSASFGRKVRDLIDTAEYQAIFEGSVQVSKDKAASGNWTTVQKGVYLALGVGGSAAGKGADLLVADDLVSEQAVLYGNPETAFDQAWQYMQVGPLQRLMPGGRIVMIGTRWGRRDPIGRALQWAADNPDSLPWHEVRFPAIINGKSLWPEQWPVEQLLAKKAGMLPQFWQAQYMQEPTAEEGALIKREYWRIWPKDKAPPPVEFVLQTWDTAHEVKTRNDYSACQTWGVWFNEETSRNELILLNGFHKRMEFPELKTRAKAEYDEWEPEELIIEKKAAGAPLIQELRQMDIAVTAISPSRGTRTQSNDKYARVNAIASIFRDGCVWAPDTRWAHEIIELCAAFPNGEFDDPVDCTEMAVSRYRRGGFLRLSDDAPEDDNLRIPRPAAYY